MICALEGEPHRSSRPMTSLAERILTWPAVTFFVLGLVIWIGWTIATVQTDPSGDPLPPQGGPSAPTASAQDDDSVESQA